MSGMCNAADSAVCGDGAGAGEFMLFGVRFVVDSMRKSVSMNNLSQYEHPQDASNNSDRKEDTVAAGYASADDALTRNSDRNRERKRGVPWTEEEHKLFLLGLQKVGKGDWRGISRNFVKTRTPTQVASHAQKYFLRRSNLNRRRRRRSSLFDITTDSVTPMPMEKEQGQHEDSLSQLHQLHTLHAKTTNMSGFPFMPTLPVGADIPDLIENSAENLTLGKGNLGQNELIKLARPFPISLDAKASMVQCDNINSNPAIDPASLSLKLSLQSEARATPSRHSAFQAMPCFNNGDTIISVA